MTKFWRTEGGSSDAVFGVAIYRREHRDTWWFKRIILPIYRAGRWVSGARSGLRSRLIPKYQHHLIRTGLEPGWHDCDEVMLHGCFALLRRYIEWEMGGAAAIERFNQKLRLMPDPNAPDGLEAAQADGQSEALQLYHWWTVTKPADEAERDRMCAHLYGRKSSATVTASGGIKYTVDEPWTEADQAMNKKYRALEQKIDSDEQEMLHRLIDLRRSMWT